jgi:alkylation response protein AidB-like acyl-CoA dehydrogenase
VIDLALDDELELLRETARGFAAGQLRPREREHEAARAVAPEVRDLFDKTGLAALELPETLGGAALGALARALVVEELAAADAGAALALDRLGPALYGLDALPGALETLARPLLDDPAARAVLVFDERDALVRRGTRAEGTLPWLPADRADLLVVLRPDEVFVVREGVELSALPGAGLRAAGASALRLADAPVLAHTDDARAVTRVRARARLYGAAALVGVMRASAEASRAYALERVAFGRPIAHHQALAFLIVDMASALEGARLLLWEAAVRLDRGEDAAEACATAFLEAAEQALFVTPNGLQILGGHGFMQDYPLEKQMREARALGLLFGGVDAAREEAGTALVAGPTPVELTSTATGPD